MGGGAGGGETITAWAWVQPEDEADRLLDPETGDVYLAATEDAPIFFTDITSVLPAAITATVDGSEETVSLARWVCDAYPKNIGAWAGEYRFGAALPEGFALAQGVKALEIWVRFDPAARPATQAAARGAAPVMTQPTAKEGLTYNGYEQELINPGTFEEGTTGAAFYYALMPTGSTAPDKSAFSTDIPKVKDADYYTVWYYVNGGGVYDDTEPSYISIRISKASLSVNVEKETIFTAMKSLSLPQHLKAFRATTMSPC